MEPSPARIPAHQHPPARVDGGAHWTWDTTIPAARIYHADSRTAHGAQPRTHGPHQRFDPHRPAMPADVDPDGRSVLYLAEAVETSVCESIGRNSRLPALCPQWKLVLLGPPAVGVVLQDFVKDSPAVLGAPDDLGDGHWHYGDTQAWARAVYEHKPAHDAVSGIRYWSRRHREPGGARRGVNLVTWDTAPPLGPSPATRLTEVSLHRIWRRVLDACRTIDVYPRLIDRSECGKCLSHPLPAGTA